MCLSKKQLRCDELTVFLCQMLVLKNIYKLIMIVVILLIYCTDVMSVSFKPSLVWFPCVKNSFIGASSGTLTVIDLYPELSHSCKICFVGTHCIVPVDNMRCTTSVPLSLHIPTYQILYLHSICNKMMFIISDCQFQRL